MWASRIIAISISKKKPKGHTPCEQRNIDFIQSVLTHDQYTCIVNLVNIQNARANVEIQIITVTVYVQMEDIFHLHYFEPKGHWHSCIKLHL